MANVKITVPMFRGINIFDQEVVGQLLVVGDTACIIPLNGERGDWNKNFMCFDGNHLTQGMYDENDLGEDEKNDVQTIINTFKGED